MYEEFVLQKSSYAHRTLDVPILERHHGHRKEEMLIGTSRPNGPNGRLVPELMYIPSMWELAPIWRSALTDAEYAGVRRLAKACSSVPSLLAHRLNEHWLLEDALITVADNQAHWFHGCVHLRWNLQCAGAAAAVHDFPQKRKRRKVCHARSGCNFRTETLTDPTSDHAQAVDGSVIDPGTVTLVYSPHGPKEGPKDAFRSRIIPLARMMQAVLKQLPANLRKQIHPDIKLDLFDLEYTYVSLNIFWDAGTSPRLPKHYFHHLGDRWA